MPMGFKIQPIPLISVKLTQGQLPASPTRPKLQQYASVEIGRF
jgi:hypothetical protein